MGRIQPGNRAHAERTQTRTHQHILTHLHSAHLHMKGQGWKVFPVERGRICVLTPNC